MDKAKLARNTFLALTAASIIGSYVCLHSANVLDKNIRKDANDYTASELDDMEKDRSKLIDAGMYGISTSMLFGLASGASELLKKTTTWRCKKYFFCHYFVA